MVSSVSAAGGSVSQPGANLLVGQNQRHSVVDALDRGIGRGGQYHITVDTVHVVVDARQIDGLPRHLEEVFVFACIPLIIAAGRDHAPLGGHAAAEHRLVADCLGAGVDHQSAAPTGNPPTLILGHDLVAAGDQHRRDLGGRDVARHREIQFAREPPAAAALGIAENLLHLAAFRGRKLITATHTVHPLI